MYVYDATEQAYRNGANYMKSLILTLLSDMKGTAMGPTRMTISDIIEKVQKMEVRP